MQINKIYPFNYFNTNKVNNNQKKEQPLKEKSMGITNPLNFYFNDYLLTFEARVDKGLTRFYEENKDRMPYTVKNYIETLPNKRGISPLQAQYNAYSNLSQAQTVEDIKQTYPNEELFSQLKQSSDNKAKRGLLYDIRIMADDLKKDGEFILSNEEDLSVYIVKKIFLEAKTLKEINEDIDKDINPLFKKDDKNYINYSTLDTLGIKLPNSEYLTSLRFTRDGYSDEIGSKISEAQQKYYENLSPEERSQRAKKSLSNIENWWNSLSDNEKKELLLSQDQELKLLKKYQRRKKVHNKEQVMSKQDIKDSSTFMYPYPATDKQVQKKEKLHTSLIDDPMFLEWAEKNLKIYYENLSEEEKQQISENRAQTMLNRWNSMNEAQKADYIDKMQTGSEKQRFAMINAWNNCKDIRNHMSEFMKEKNIHNPGNLIYRSQEYTEAQRNLMIAFWQSYPEDAQKLGEEIKKSWEEINKAVSNNSFDELKESIILTQTRIKKDMKKHHPSKNIEKKPELSNFEKAYRKAYPYLPEEYMQTYFRLANQTLDNNDLKIWTKLLNKQYISEIERKYLAQKMKYIDDSAIFTEKRAMEQALAEILYKVTDEPNLFSLHFNDLNLIASIAENVELDKSTHQTFRLTSEDNTQRTVTIKRKPNFSKIDKLYKKYNKQLSDEEVESIIKTNFFIGEEDKPKMEQPLKDFLRKYGSASIFIFSPYGTEETKVAALQKFQHLMPKELKQEGINSQVLDKSFEDTVYEKYSKSYNFIPEEFRRFYIKQITKDNTSPECRSLLQSLNSDNMTIPEMNYNLATPDEPHQFSKEFIIKRVAIEQAIAESIYEQAKNPLIFSLTYEQLASIAKHLKTLPSSDYPLKYRAKFNENDKIEIVLTLHAPINTDKIEEKYNKYKKELTQQEKLSLRERSKTNYYDIHILENYGSTINLIENPQIKQMVYNKLCIYRNAQE